jgi:GT2 family glycosyltransferase
MVGAETTRWGISLHNYLKTYYAPLLFRPHLFFRGLRLLFGDQVMFCRRADFWDCGGFNEALPIMEDGDLCLRLLNKLPSFLWRSGAAPQKTWMLETETCILPFAT